jgi:hypothetical protein
MINTEAIHKKWPGQIELKNFHFYLLRIRNSSLPELVYRLRHFIFIKKLKIRHSKNEQVVAIPKIELKNIKDLQPPTIHGETSESQIKDILNGKLFILHAELEDIRGYEIRWHNTFFSSIKTAEQGTDLRPVGEPARFQHITILLNYIIQNKNSELVDNVLQFTKENVLKWIHENPFLYGPHYISAMECGLRIPVLFYCLKVLDNLTPAEFQLILDTLYRHAWWISNCLSLYSSRGNHTIAEANGLIFGGAAYRSTAEGRQWLSKGHELLKRELVHQIANDGGAAEQSLNYHRFVIDLYWLAIDFLTKNNLHDCADFRERLIKAENFITAFKDAHCRVPSIGDSDDGYAIAPGLRPHRTHPNNNKQKIQTFSESGYTIVNGKNFVLTFDHGPLGMAPLFNHGHADALSITLSVGGQKLLVDPGTYKYNGEPEFRKYFKGTWAHNTITVDGQDQAIQETGFIWSRAYNTELMRKEKLNGVWLIQAKHDGYLRYKMPVQHIRSLFIFDGETIIVRDKFAGKGTHKYELNYHLHPDMKVSSYPENWWHINNDVAELYMTIFDQNGFRVIKGNRNPILGWYSNSYGYKCKTSVLNFSITRTIEEATFTTGIAIDGPFDLQAITERLGEIESAIEHP